MFHFGLSFHFLVPPKMPQKVRKTPQNGKPALRCFTLYIAIPLKDLDHHADNILGRSSPLAVPVLHCPQRDAEALRYIGLSDAVLDADVFDCHAHSSPFKLWAGRPALGLLVAVLCRLRGILEEAESILDVGAVVPCLVQFDNVLPEETIKTISHDELLDCLLGFLICFHIVTSKLLS